MKYRRLAIFGIATYILSVISSAENTAGDYTMPAILIILSAIKVQTAIEQAEAAMTHAI